MKTPYASIEWKGDRLRLLDQRLLPREKVFLEYSNYHDVATAIRDMVVRGAPVIGATAAYGMALAALHTSATSLEEAKRELEDSARVLAASRPTAVNLFWAIERMKEKAAHSPVSSTAELAIALVDEANAIAQEDIRTNRLIGKNAQLLVPQGAKFIHHCNTGALATVDYGTALGIIRTAHELEKNIFVFVDETRPRLQGARLTAWELDQLNIPHAVIIDGASGFVMQRHQIDLVTVGCDRVAANGDTANKIGTYNLAIVAKEHRVPFYIAAPTSTIDLNIPDGKHIEIEERDGREISQFGGEQVTPEASKIYNPAFDVTPALLITAIITEAGIARPPYEESLPKMVYQAQQLHKKNSD